MKEFCSLNGLKNIINEPTCCKNSEKPTCIDLILTNQPTLFQRMLFLRLDSLTFIYSQLLDLKWVSKNANPVLLLIGTTKTMIMPSQHFNVGSTLFKRCGNIEIMLIRRWKWNKIRRRIFNVAQRWYNVSARRWNNVETTLHNVETTLYQRCTKSRR